MNQYVKRMSAVLALAILIGTSSLSAPVAAHVLESDNGISAILHIKPDDRPVSNKPTAINFLFNDKAGGFNLNNYDVELRLLENGTTKLTSPIEPRFFGAAADGETVITFPDATVYTLQAVGRPKKVDALPFTLNFTVRVTGESGVKKGDGSTTIIVSGFSLIVLGLIATSGIQFGGKYRQNRQL